MATPQVQAVRRWIMTGAVAAITVTGTIYGAGLKSDQDVKRVRLQSAHALAPSQLFFLEHPQTIGINRLLLTTSRSADATSKPRPKKSSRNSKSRATTSS